MRDKVLFLLCCGLIVGISFVSDIRILLGTMALFLIASLKNTPVLKIPVYSALFSLLLVLPYTVLQYVKGTPDFHATILLPARSFCILWICSSVMSRINLLKVFDFSRDLTMLIAVTLTYVQFYKRTMEEFFQAYISRSMGKDSWRDRKNLILSMSGYFFHLSLRLSEEVHQAMRSRGVIEDDGT
ncbi:conserved hypothetical protein [Thermocrinis albus DSM 14484]|uniref:Cobalt transport protein n=1 Tax=Thermocrinis albus (strain DSM 14484 / JCM 11386 / HI 11/12) TaxID=638303 RepID=D3SLQ0_THEAH|nr:hypothetical protein [Thermocrinis albus]ADC89680.1 conserved hypothetical protein [Thermocrinis albus DSM 14484]